MAKCAICEKGVYFGNSVSHSHRRSNKMWKSNVKSVRVKTENGNKRMYVCTSCLKKRKSRTALKYRFLGILTGIFQRRPSFRMPPLLLSFYASS